MNDDIVDAEVVEDDEKPNVAALAVVNDATLRKRFAAKVDRSGECHLWIGSNNGRYGHIYVDGRLLRAHRVAFILAGGVIPPNHRVLHRCDTPLCVRHEHLFTGTQRDNMRDCARKNRLGGFVADKRPRGERHGRSKLDFDKADEIRALYASGEHTQYALAARYGVSQSQIWQVVHDMRWVR